MVTERARRGAAAEDAAAEHVRSIGMQLLERNLRVGCLEIDILARDGEVIVVVEVRTRGETAWQRPLDSIDHRKQKRLRRAATILWSRRFSKMPNVTRMRFDVASVVFTTAEQPTVEYIRAAF